MGFLSTLNPFGAESRARKLATKITDFDARSELLRLGPVAIPAVRELLRSGDELVRSNAIYVLWDLGTPDARDGIAEALTDTSSTMRYQAAISLADHRDRRALAPLTELLRSGDADQRQMAARGLGFIGDATSLELLEQHTDRGDAARKGFFDDAIARIKMRRSQPSRAIDTMRDLMPRKDDANFAAMLAILGSSEEEFAANLQMPRDAFSATIGGLTCDLCSGKMFAEDRARCFRVPARIFREFLRYGYNPVLTVVDPRHRLGILQAIPAFTHEDAAQRAGLAQAVEGINRLGLEGYFESWKMMALASSTDWALCPGCARDLDRWRWEP